MLKLEHIFKCNMCTLVLGYILYKTPVVVFIFVIQVALFYYCFDRFLYLVQGTLGIPKQNQNFPAKSAFLQRTYMLYAATREKNFAKIQTCCSVQINVRCKKLSNSDLLQRTNKCTLQKVGSVAAGFYMYAATSPKFCQFFGTCCSVHLKARCNKSLFAANLYAATSSDLLQAPQLQHTMYAATGV